MRAMAHTLSKDNMDGSNHAHAGFTESAGIAIHM